MSPVASEPDEVAPPLAPELHLETAVALAEDAGRGLPVRLGHGFALNAPRRRCHFARRATLDGAPHRGGYDPPRQRGGLLAGIGDFFAELKRRRVIRALVGWGLFSFALLQVYEPVMHGLHLPEWTLSFVVVVLGLGFPVTAALAWVFDLKVGGIERTRPAADEGDG